MSANNAVIHEHTVPVCYLANFGIHGNQGRRSILYYHNKLDGNSGVSGVVSFPVEKYFYDIENAREYEQIIEKFYAKVEGDLSLLLKAIINSVVIDPKSRKVPKVQLTSEQKDLISAHLAMLRTRTRAFRDFYKDIYLQLKNGFPFAQIPYYDEKDFKRLHLMEIVNFKMSNFYANLVNDRNWAFLINHTDIPFITSDNPVVIIDNRKTKQGSISPASPEVTLVLSITPNIAIEIYDRTILKADFSYFDIYQKKNICWYNRQIYEQSTRFVFSNASIQATEYKRR